MSAAAAAFVPTFISFDDDDDFGEFEFAAAPASASPPPPNHASSKQQQWQKPAGDEDDDWGDFVEGPLQPQPFSSPAPPPPSSSFFDPFPGTPADALDPAPVHPVPPVAADKGWQKPSGALPLSLFGEDEEDVGGGDSSNSLDPQISALKVGTFASFKSAGSNGVAAAQGEGLKDLIVSLYGQVNKVGPATAGNSDGSGDSLEVHSVNGAQSDFANGGDDEDEFNENCWEFKDALGTPVGDSSDCALVEEGESAGVPGAEANATDRRSGFQNSGNYTLKVDGQKCNNMLGHNPPTRVLSDEEWGNAFVSHDTTINVFDARSADNGCNGSSSNAHHDFEHVNIENGFSPSKVSGDTNLDDIFWVFKDASSNTETMKHFTEPEADKVDPATSGDSNRSGDNLKVHSVNGANSDLTNSDQDDEDEFNKSCWEFKGTLSSTHVEDSSDCVLVEKEGELAGVPRVEVKAMHTGLGFQHSGDCTLKANGQKFNNMLGSNLPSRVLSDGGEWVNAFASHDTTINGFDVRSPDNDCNGSISNAHHDVEHVNVENGLSPNVINGDMRLDDSFWEFKDASANTKTMNHFTEPESINHVGFHELENLCMSTCSNGNQDFGDSFPIIEAHQYGHNSIVNGSEDVKACSVVNLNDLVLNMYNDSSSISAVTSKWGTHNWQDSAESNETLKGADNIDLKHAGLETENVKHKFFYRENMDKLDSSADPEKIVDFYSRLKQKSCTLVLHHIENIKKANGEEVPGEEPKAVHLDDEIKAAFSKVGIPAVESDHIEKSPNELYVYDLLGVFQNPCFQAFDMEYGLSEKIQLAAKDLSSAMWLFEHASHILRILALASYKEQHTFIISWSKLVSACEKELLHGAVIWSQAQHANIHKELLSESQGQQYFLALGEIYRVVEILSASIKVYKAWILLNPADSSVFLTCIKKSLEVWKALKQALEIISESLGELKVVTEALLQSITFISELSTHTLQSQLSDHKAHFCRFSLLPLELLPDIKQVVWQGDHYFSKLANLWANRISCDAPQLPRIHVGQ